MTAPDLTAREAVILHSHIDAREKKRAQHFPSGAKFNSPLTSSARDYELDALLDALVASLVHDYGVLQRERMTYAQQLGAVIVERDALITEARTDG